MTFLEKAKLNFPKMKEDKITDECPQDFNLEKESICQGRGCYACWNREMPNTELKAEILKEVHEHFGTEESDISYVEGLEHGRNEVWEFMKKWDEMMYGQTMEVFGSTTLRFLLERHTPQEAIAKLKTYEEAQIEVGDVVLYGNSDVEIIITAIYGNSFDGVKTKTDDCGRMGGTYYSRNLCDCKKTGKHLDIKSILESIGE